MTVDKWRERLLAACDADPRSDYEISEAAELGRNYVQQLRKSPRSPSIDNVITLAATLGVSLAYILLGRESVTPEDELFLEALRDSTPAGRTAALAALEALKKATPEE